jgi:predicted RNA binding protein YcfA (HicA-like mRNA interferase family)
MVLAPEHRHMPLRTLALYAQRVGMVFASVTTWAKLVRERGWRRPRRVSGARLVRALARAGFVEVHRHGSHVMIAHRDDASRATVVPVHKRQDIPPGTLRSILKGLRLEIEELRELL